MIAAIMQPYFFPYIGYFQLMHAVDVFVVYDDVQYMKGGWINRNRISTNGRPQWLTLPIVKASLVDTINRRHYVLDSYGKAAIKRRLSVSYRDAPCKDAVLPFLTDMIDFSESNVAIYNTHLLSKIAQSLDIDCRIVASSALQKPPESKGQERVIDICRQVGANVYINPIGGRELYNATTFAGADIDLSFLQTSVPPVRVADGDTHLSIIDTLLNRGIDGTRALLDDFQLVRR